MSEQDLLFMSYTRRLEFFERDPEWYHIGIAQYKASLESRVYDTKLNMIRISLLSRMFRKIIEKE